MSNRREYSKDYSNDRQRQQERQPSDRQSQDWQSRDGQGQSDMHATGTGRHYSDSKQPGSDNSDRHDVTDRQDRYDGHRKYDDDRKYDDTEYAQHTPFQRHTYRQTEHQQPQEWSAGLVYGSDYYDSHEAQYYPSSRQNASEHRGSNDRKDLNGARDERHEYPSTTARQPIRKQTAQELHNARYEAAYQQQLLSLQQQQSTPSLVLPSNPSTNIGGSEAAVPIVSNISRLSEKLDWKVVFDPSIGSDVVKATKGPVLKRYTGQSMSGYPSNPLIDPRLTPPANSSNALEKKKYDARALTKKYEMCSLIPDGEWIHRIANGPGNSTPLPPAIFVSNLPKQMNPEAIKSHFTSYLQVLSVSIVIDPKTQLSTGQCRVVFQLQKKSSRNNSLSGNASRRSSGAGGGDKWNEIMDVVRACDGSELFGEKLGVVYDPYGYRLSFEIDKLRHVSPQKSNSASVASGSKLNGSGGNKMVETPEVHMLKDPIMGPKDYVRPVRNGNDENLQTPFLNKDPRNGSNILDQAAASNVAHSGGPGGSLEAVPFANFDPQKTWTQSQFREYAIHSKKPAIYVHCTSLPTTSEINADHVRGFFSGRQFSLVFHDGQNWIIEFDKQESCLRAFDALNGRSLFQYILKMTLRNCISRTPLKVKTTEGLKSMDVKRNFKNREELMKVAEGEIKKEVISALIRSLKGSTLPDMLLEDGELEILRCKDIQRLSMQLQTPSRVISDVKPDSNVPVGSVDNVEDSERVLPAFKKFSEEAFKEQALKDKKKKSKSLKRRSAPVIIENYEDEVVIDVVGGSPPQVIEKPKKSRKRASAKIPKSIVVQSDPMEDDIIDVVSLVSTSKKEKEKTPTHQMKMKSKLVKTNSSPRKKLVTPPPPPEPQSPLNKYISKMTMNLLDGNDHDIDTPIIDDEDLIYLSMAMECLCNGKKPKRVNRVLFNNDKFKSEDHSDDIEVDDVQEPFVKEKKTGNSSGSARCQGFYLIPQAEKSQFLAHRNKVLQQEELELQQNAVGPTLSTSRTARIDQRRQMVDTDMIKMSSTSNNDILKFNQLKARKKQMKFAQSSIHDWGLFALEKIEAGDMVIEYIGEVVRQKVADTREKRYEKMGIGSSYLFRVDKDEVVDATMSGNLARFINHCCGPNCTAKIITVENQKKIVIYAARTIEIGEEITYDYKFPLEDEKIPCLCGSTICRGSLN